MSAGRDAGGVPPTLAIPPFGLAAALMLWGLATGAWPYAAVMAVVLEAARASSWRWQLADKDYERLSDATALGFVVVVFYVFDAHSFQGVYVILEWLPYLLFLLAVAQRYGSRGTIRYSALFLSVRRAERKGVVGDAGAVNFDIPFAVACLVSATGGELGGPWLFAGLAAVCAFLLFANRPRRSPAAMWAAALLLALATGWLGQLGLLQARRAIEPMVMDFIRDRVMGYRSPYRSYTALGQIGRLKLSDRIVLRISGGGPGGVPTLLHEATYRSFSKNIWLAGRTEFEPRTPDVEGTTWELAPEPEQGARGVRIARAMVRGRGLLAVPRGTYRVDNLPVEELHRNELGALKVTRGPGLIHYTARYSPRQSFALAPSAEDLRVPRDLEPLMARVLDQLDLPAGAPAAALRKLQRFFSEDFEYSVVLRGPGPIATPLHDFLLGSRSGHCEFFASATVLLLRAHGIPARYATGYSVQEYSPLERAWVVRRRHAHSWAMAYVNGEWIDFDTTPPTWAALEAESAPWWEGSYDLLSWLAYRFSRWRWSGGDDEQSQGALVWLILPLAVVLVWRIAGARRISARRRRRAPARMPGPGADSEFYEIARVLEARGFARGPGETAGEWLTRLSRRGAPGIEEILEEILPIHYRYRFDPSRVGPGERAALGRKARDWLGRHRA